MVEALKSTSAYSPSVLLEDKRDHTTCVPCGTQDFARTSRSSDVRQEILMCLNCGRRWRVRYCVMPEHVAKMPRMGIGDARREVRARQDRKAIP